ncbi:VCBS domain-containing protein [Marinobacter sp. HN1S83]|uniref:VCBS domain-containing protein n=1 Tax=Marinobacter sp. HN1S83 TaxID=3382301 RepID=UPI00387B3D3F
MKSAVFPKSGNGSSRTFDGDRVTLEAPGVVQLQIGPEQVARFERDGSDLVLVLEDGTVFVIENFFVETADERSDLVFEDGNGITWWAQYGDVWNGFDIAEINDNVAATPFPWAAPLAGLGLLAGGAALAEHGSGSSSDAPSNVAPAASADPVTTPGDTPVRGLVRGTDPDGDQLTFELSGDPEHGTVTVNPDGNYEYTPDEDYDGPDSFEVTVDDGNGGTDIVTVPVMVTPGNEPATISGETEGAAVEAGGVDNGTPGSLSASGSLTVSDADEGEAVFETPASLEGTYGTFTFDSATGAWTYTLEDGRAATQALTDGEIVTDELAVSSLDGTANESIAVTITGTNDVAVVTDDSGQVTEDSDVEAGLLSTSGQVAIDDVDAGENRLDAPSLAFESASHGGPALGNLSVESDGSWTYRVDNSLAEVQSLVLGETMTESWTVISADGTDTGTITVTITGTNDLPDISGEATGDVAEDGVLSTSGQLAVDDIDTSNTHGWSVEGSTGEYGELTVDTSTGEWTYTLDNDDARVQALAEGETLTDEITVRVTDNDGGYDEQVVTVTITGSNDTPDISAGSDTTAMVTELTDGDTDENTLEHSQTGTIEVSDLDTTDTHSVDSVPQGTGYLGTFTPGTIDPETGELDWTFTVDDADLDVLSAGEVLTQEYQVTVEDSQGASDTVTVEVTINGANDRPEPEDDTTLIAPGDIAVLDVLANDTDVDAGETATLTVTQVDGQAIAPGGSITLSGDRGTVSLNGNGELTFVPGPNAPEQLVLPYTVDDGSGAGDATATANWVIDIAGVTISDDASPAGADVPDDVLSSVDDLGQVSITGQAAVGGTVTSLTISDGTNSVDVPAAGITVQPDGSYSVTADLSGLDDGTLTVTADVEDAEGNPATSTDTILKDTATPVAIDPVLVVEGEAPTITGTGEPGAAITLDVDGETYSATVQSEGAWSVTLPDPLGTENTEISAQAVDDYGNTNSAGRTVTGLTVTDEVAGEPEDIVVSESALTGGSQEGSGADAVSSTFALVADVSELSEIVIGGTVAGGTLSGGDTVTLAQLQDAATTPVDVSTQYGTLTITGFDAGTGAVSYTYTLDGNTEDHSAGALNDIVRETIQVAAVETDGDIRVGELTAAVVDDVAAPVDDTPMSVAEGGSTVGGANLLANDTLGADGGRVHEITYTDRSGTSASAVIPDGGSETVETQYGELTVGSDGTWSYTPLASADHAKPDNDTELSDDFSYTTIDGDGDVSAEAAMQPVTVTDSVPELGTPDHAIIDEEHLPTGSNPDPAQREVSGSLDLTPGQDSVNVTLTTDSAPAGLQSSGEDLRYELSADGHSLTAYKGAGTEAVFVVTLTDPTSASAGYTFELLQAIDHNGAESQDLAFGVEVTDSDGDTDTAGFIVEVVDNAPLAEIERDIDEDSSGFSFNISADATSDNTSLTQDGTSLTGTSTPGGGMEYKTGHGTVTISADGEVTYVPDTNYSGTETFEVTTSDDGTNATTTVTANVAPVADAPGVSVDTSNINTLEDTAVALGLEAPTITDDGGGTGNNTTPERIGEITLSGLPEGAVLQGPFGTTTVDASGSVTITLSDPGLTVTGTSADLTMTSAELEALEVLPPEHASGNFEVNYTVTSYEVDGSGTVLAGVDGTTSSDSVTVHVQAVTDPAALVFDSSVDDSTVDNADAISYGGDGGNTQADVTLKEDTTVDLSEILSTSFDDLDGSELRSITISNNTGADIVVNGETIASGDDVTVAAPGLSGDTEGLPAINIGGADDFSGDLEGITVTLNAQDRDADGYWDGAEVPGPADGVAEADESDNSVTLNLHVTPVADDVQVDDAEGDEDSAIAFLSGVRLTDGSADVSAGGSEVITEVSFEVPAGWEVADSTVSNGASTGASAGLSGGTYTITFTGGTEAEREEYLDGFTITPPAHDSSDATITLRVSSEDESSVNGSTETDTALEREHDLTITVNPVAEEVGTDTDGDTNDDLTMAPDFSYSSSAQEDQWFDLNSDGFDLSAGWLNQDSGEETFARLTPELIAGDGGLSDATGSQFRWMEDGVQKEAVYNGTPIDVPASALDTLEFRAADDFSGQFDIKVQAFTVDADDDGGTNSSEAVSGEATLTNVLITPVADDVTLSLASRTQGSEDEDIPLNIRPTSSDPSEVFTVTIADIPDGAVLTYDGNPLTVAGGSVTIENFDSSAPLTLRPPEHSNDDLTLNVTAQSVDELEVDGTTYSDSSDPISLDMDVEIQGVADQADVSVTPQEYAETNLDSGADSVTLADLLSVDKQDSDGSETLTVRISDLPEGFGLTQGTSLGTAVGEDRVWVLSEAQLATAEITVPDNFNGEVSFSAVPVTTESDGDSLTGTEQTVNFAVTPSPEADITTGAGLNEDARQPINLGIVHQGGDTDEALEAAGIKVSDTVGADFTLYLGSDALADAGLDIINVGGVDYYELTAAQAGNLTAQGSEHLDGDLDGFDLIYRITDPGNDGLADVTSDWQNGHFDLGAAAVTDQPDLAIDSITLGSGSGSVSGNDVTVTSAGEPVTLDLNVSTPDSDGSEHLIRVLIDDVPDGVTVEGGEMTSGGSWLLIYDEADALSVNDAGGLVVPVTFTVGDEAAGIADVPITVTVQTQDRGNEPGAGTEVLADSLGWNLTADFEGSGDSTAPPTIDTWEYNEATATEDTSFLLSDMLDAQVTAQSTESNLLTVTLTDLPAGTEVTGMVRTTVDGQEVWTASVTTDPGDDPAAVQAKLDGLMSSIVIDPADNANENNAADELSFNATLTSAVAGGRSEEQTVAPTIPVDPVTDEAGISITTDGERTEADSDIPLTVTVTNPEDGEHGTVEGGELYLQIDGTNGLGEGTLTLDGVTYTAESVTGVDGIADGDYYVIDGVTMGAPLEGLVFTPDTMSEGEITVDAWVRNRETGATATTSEGSATLPVAIVNEGVSLSSDPTTGSEAANSDKESLTELDLDLALSDADGSEEIATVLLSNLPEGFLLYTGPSESDATLAEMTTNAGGLDGTNTWVLSEGSLPNYIGILPPKNWSGTLEDLSLTVTSGETALSESLVESFEVGNVTVNPVANGIELTPTKSFGAEGGIVSLNLNASMADSEDASVTAAPDDSVETTTLELQGLGEHASFYIGEEIVTSGVSYEAGTDTYTLTGLSQTDLDGLGFRQATSALTDMDGGTSGLQINVTARTSDGTDVSDDVAGTATIDLSEQLPSTSDDSLIWTGESIDGLGGSDTIEFREGESLTGDELATQLSNIETLELGIDGSNSIDDLTPEQVEAMTDGDSLLTIRGSGEDEVSLSGDWSDNGDGSYTGTTSSGGGDVTLTVEDVTVTPPVSGFAASSMVMSSGDTESFGLASLDTQEAPEADEPEAETVITMDEVLSAESGGEDLTAGLPEEDTGDAAPTDDASTSDPGRPMPGSTLEDELQSGVLYDV